MHRRRPCNACWPDDLPMIKFKFSHCTTPGSNSGSITNNLCGVTQVTQHLRVPGNYCAQCPANNLLVVSVSIVAARPTLRLMLSLHPLLKTCTPAIPSQGLLPGHIIILPISEFEIFVVSSPSRVGFPNWLWTCWGRHYAFSHSSLQNLAHFLGRHLTNISWINYEVKVKVAHSCPTLCNPMDHTVHGILQARILKWVAAPFFRGSSQPRDLNQVSHIAGGFFTSRATREALN